MRAWAYATDAVDEFAVATVLQTVFRNTLESDVYGTPACRACIVGQHGTWLNQPWPTRLPLTISLATKLARFMGASDGRWNIKYNVGRAPNNVITDFINVSNRAPLPNTQGQWWGSSLTYAVPWSTTHDFYPGIQSIYSRVGSVLCPFVNVLACCYLEKVAFAAWQSVTGDADLSDKQLSDRCNKTITTMIAGRFSNLFTITPRTLVTKQDLQQGYSFTGIIDIYANTMRIEGNYTVQAYNTNQLSGGT